MTFIDDFVAEWMGGVPRCWGTWWKEKDTIPRRYTINPYSIIDELRRKTEGIYTSVQPYCKPLDDTKANHPTTIEKVFFDFDWKDDPQVAWDEASQFSILLERKYRVSPLGGFSDGFCCSYINFHHVLIVLTF